MLWGDARMTNEAINLYVNDLRDYPDGNIVAVSNEN